MNEKSTENFDAINKDASVGSRKKVLIVNPPIPKKDRDGRYAITVNKTSKVKRRKCSGCSRKRKIG